VIVVCGQMMALGRAHAGQTVAVAVSDTTLAIELDDQETRVVHRTTTHQSVTSKPTGRGRSPQFPRANDNHHLTRIVQPPPGWLLDGVFSKGMFMALR
jgi:hypothetical protein